MVVLRKVMDDLNQGLKAKSNKALLKVSKTVYCTIVSGFLLCWLFAVILGKQPSKTNVRLSESYMPFIEEVKLNYRCFSSVMLENFTDCFYLKLLFSSIISHD